MRPVFGALFLIIGINLQLLAETVKGYHIKYGTYSGGYVKYYGANTWHNFNYFVTCDRMYEMFYMGNGSPMKNEPYKIYQEKKCFHVIPPQSYYDITDYHPINKAGGDKQYLQNIYNLKMKLIEKMDPKSVGKKVTAAGFKCDLYVGKASDGSYMQFYFSQDPRLKEMLADIYSSTEYFANTMIKSIFFEHPKFGILMKYENIEEPSRENPLYKPSFKGSKFVIIAVEETMIDPSMFSLDGMKELPVGK
jgi:hypothetical protein